MRRYKKFFYVISQYKRVLYKTYIINIINYWFVTSINMYSHYLVYVVRARNKIVSFIHRYAYMIWAKSYNSLVPIKYFYDKSFFWHLFIEVVAYNLVHNKWNKIGICLRGRYYTFIYFYRYLIYIYKKWNKRLLYINYVKLIASESYSMIRKKKYPRRKRRLIREAK